MRILITGGTGLIGRALTAQLAAAGYEVLVLSRAPERVTELPAGARAIRWDGRSAQGWGPLADGAAAIINLAGENIGGGLWTSARRERIRLSRLNAGRAVVEAVQAAAQKPRVVLQASGIGYYGPRGDEPITEAASAGHDFLAQVAVPWEASTAPVEALGVRRVILRSAAVLSRAGGVLPLMALPFRFFVGGPLGNGRQWQPWIHLADEVGAIRFLLEHEEAAGPFNLVAPGVVTNADFGRALAKVLRRPYGFPTPAFALRLLLGELADGLLLNGQRAIPERLLALGYTFKFPLVEQALADLLR